MEGPAETLAGRARPGILRAIEARASGFESTWVSTHLIASDLLTTLPRPRGPEPDFTSKIRRFLDLHSRNVRNVARFEMQDEGFPHRIR